MVTTDGVFPEVDRVEAWPRDRSKSAVIIPVVFTALFSVLAVTPILWAPWDAGPVVLLGASGGVLAFLGFAYFFGSLLLVNIPRRNPGITPCVDDRYGPGVQLAVDRRESMRLVPALAGISIYGLCGWLDWQAGGDSLLPMSKSNTGGATVALVFSVVLAVALLLVSIVGRWAIQVGIHPSGIVRTSRPFGKEKKEFVPWGDVAELAPGRFSSGKAKNLPVLRINLSDSSTPPRSKMFDEPGIFTIPIYTYRCDPNALFSVLVFLHDNPEWRNVLTHPDAPQWFLRVERGGRNDHRIREKEGDVG